MKNRIFPFLPIITWLILTFYSVSSILLHEYLMTNAHYFNLILLGITLVAFVFGNNIGQLICLISFFIGFFGKSTFLVAYHWFKAGNYEYSWIYFPLVIFFLFVNYEVIGYWLERFFKKENQ